MSTEPERSRIPEEALKAFLDGVLAEVKAPADPLLLTRMRSLFRKHVPLHLRSYAAALLILRAAGLSQNQSQSQKTTKPETRAQRPAPVAQRRTTQPKEQAQEASTTPRTAKMIPLFVSMGKRQRLRPQELRELVSQKSGVDPEALGRVHLFDNYSFLDVKEELAEKIVAAAEGFEYKGRAVEIKPAKRKGEPESSKDGAE